ncbi:MAG TPA: NAD-dependent epimerase/dehydratase family protein [Solirubrobacteraceae bacterium]|nr:NAD-dependent epimerase/dehydratase family protein [Solirubrobacteraceae bacterium]HSD79264.1 NAD-dependent epimerase/dehydratase family protein [Solirubrobacteraceae bacterium]
MTPSVAPLMNIGIPTATRRSVSTYVVTGCAGFIGSHLCEALLNRGDDVIGIDALTDYYPRELKEANLQPLAARPGFVFIEEDLCEAPIEALAAGTQGIFHLAAQPGVRGSWGATFETYVHDNLLATQRVFEAASGAGVRVVFASSSSVYGNAEAYPTTEDTPPSPVSPYGVTKLCCEHLAEAYSQSRDLEFIALRYFTVYGPRQRPDMAGCRIATALADGGTFQVYGTGEQSRDVTYVDDAVRATIAVMEAAPAGSIYNVGGGSETSLREIIELSEALCGRTLDARYGTVAVGDVRRTAADTGRILADVGWAPTTSLEEGIASQLAWVMSRDVSSSAPIYSG